MNPVPVIVTVIFAAPLALRSAATTLAGDSVVIVGTGLVLTVGAAGLDPPHDATRRAVTTRVAAVANDLMAIVVFQV